MSNKNLFGYGMIFFENYNVLSLVFNCVYNCIKNLQWLVNNCMKQTVLAQNDGCLETLRCHFYKNSSMGMLGNFLTSFGGIGSAPPVFKVLLFQFLMLTPDTMIYHLIGKLMICPSNCFIIHSIYNWSWSDQSQFLLVSQMISESCCTWRTVSVTAWLPWLGSITLVELI